MFEILYINKLHVYNTELINTDYLITTTMDFAHWNSIFAVVLYSCVYMYLDILLRFVLLQQSFSPNQNQIQFVHYI